KVPDGIAVSADSRWVAVSSHLTHDVKVYDARSGLNWRTKPAATLTGSRYPHGVRFAEGGRFLLVADAGSPYVLVYERGDEWRGSLEPRAMIRVLDDATFEQGRTNPTEGGPKGIDI